MDPNRNWIFLLIFTLGLAAQAAHYDQLSEVEKTAVDAALDKYQLRTASDPIGKAVGTIYVDNQSPFASTTIFRLLNYVHFTTKDYIVSRDILLAPGDLFSEQLLQESEIILRSGVSRSIAVIVPVYARHHPRAGQVDLLAVTRDVFGWRLDSDLSANGSSINKLHLGITQYNLLGLNKRLGVSFALAPETMSFSGSYSDARVWGTWHSLALKSGVVLQRYSQNFAGVFGSLALKLPLYSRASEWGYGAEVEYYYGPKYFYERGQIQIISVPGDSASPTIEAKYQWLDVLGTLSLSRSYGDNLKANVELGYNVHVYRPEFFREKHYSALAQSILKKAVFPAREFESYLSLGIIQFRNSFYTLYNYDTFMLAEVFRLGPSYSLSGDLGLIYPLFSEANFFRVNGAAGWTFGAHDYLVRLTAAAGTRFDGQLSDSKVSMGIYAASASFFGIGRLLIRADYKQLLNNRMKEQIFLGGDSGLRGLPSRYYAGDQRSLVSVEFRTSSLHKFSSYLGLAVFYDGGSIAGTLEKARWEQSIGIGARILLIQFNRQVIRADVGFPFKRGRIAPNNALLSVNFGQAF